MQPEDFKVERVSVKPIADGIYCYRARISYGSRKWNADGVIIRRPGELSVSYNGTLYVGDDESDLQTFIRAVLPDLIVYG